MYIYNIYIFSFFFIFFPLRFKEKRKGKKKLKKRKKKNLSFMRFHIPKESKPFNLVTDYFDI